MVERSQLGRNQQTLPVVEEVAGVEEIASVGRAFLPAQVWRGHSLRLRSGPALSALFVRYLLSRGRSERRLK
jgi:hypothetical protein